MFQKNGEWLLTRQMNRCPLQWRKSYSHNSCFPSFLLLLSLSTCRDTFVLKSHSVCIHSKYLFFSWNYWKHSFKLLPLCDHHFSVQFNHVGLFATPWIAAREASLSITNSRSSLRSKVYIFSSDNSSLGTYLFPLDSILKFTSFEILEEREAYSEMWCWQKSEAKDNDKGGDRIIKSKFTNWQGSSDLGGQSV